MILTNQCNTANCVYNENGYCNISIIVEDGYCITKEIDDLRCEKCGCRLVPIKEPREFWGHNVSEEFLICPECGE